MTVTVEGLKASTKYETKLFQYGGSYRNTNGLLTLNDGTTVKVVDSTDAENPVTNTATQISNEDGKIIMKLDKNGQNQIKFSGLTITPAFEYRAPKDQNKNHDASPIRIETPGSDIVITLVGVSHIRTYAHGTSYILKLGQPHL